MASSYGATRMNQHLKPIFILQKKALHTISFSQFDSPSSPLFKSLPEVIKFYDLVTFDIATFMYKFPPTAFHSFFTKVTNIHKYNTRTIKYSKEKGHSSKAKVKDLDEKLQSCTKTCENDLSKENLEELRCLQATSISYLIRKIK